MQRTIFFSLVCLCAHVVLANDKVQPLNIKTGLWEITVTNAVSGRPPIPPDVLARMTPEQRAKFEAAMKARTSGAPKTKAYKSCITKEKLSKDPFSDERKNCTRTVLKSTGSEMEIREVCGDEGVKNDTTMHLEALNPESIKGSVHVTAAGGDSPMNVNSDITAKWLGAVCTEKSEN